MDTIIQSVTQYISQYLTTAVLFPIAVFSALLLYFVNYLHDGKGMKSPETQLDGEEIKPRFLPIKGIHPMTGKDIKILLAITAIYTVVAFWGLGDKKAPETFYHFDGPEYTFTITLKDVSHVGKIMYYTGLYTGEYGLRWSADGTTWSDMKIMQQEYSKLFCWQYADIGEGADMKFIQLWARYTPLEMGEMALYNGDGSLIPASSMKFSNEHASLLFDEQDKLPKAPSYLNSMYFDEIYHGRTALENIDNVYPYEISHPPLGKLIISLGIRLFGMTPFGWRFMGTLFGILMLPFMYALIKNIFGKTLIAASGTVLFAFDFMHFVQTRIATIDTYGVFFILAMFYFMYRYIAQDYETPFGKTALPLFLSGLCFGIGSASKWIVIYGGAGLALIWLLRQIMVGRHFAGLGRKKEYYLYILKTVLFSVLAFIIVPVIIYVLSYIPYGTAKGMTVSGGMLLNKDFYDIIIENQKFMFGYHSKLVATHPYSSPWFSWLLDIRPILYYLDYLPDGNKSAFGAFGNPIVWWGGLIALIYTCIDFWKRRDGRALFIIIGYLAQLLPWVGIKRIVFIYHYFPSTVFLVLATCYAFNRIYERGIGHSRRAIAGYALASVVLFIAFYPVLTGVPVPQWYTSNFLQWIPGVWPF